MTGADDFTPMAGSAGDLELICPLCGDWVSTDPGSSDVGWLTIGQLREQAEAHLREEHAPVIEGVAETGRSGWYAG